MPFLRHRGTDTKESMKPDPALCYHRVRYDQVTAYMHKLQNKVSVHDQ